MEPVVILGMPRSGSSMVAGLFAEHGCWYGRCRAGDKMNPKGYYENLDIKDWMIRNHGRLAQTTQMARRGKPLRPFVKGLLKGHEGPWIAKHSAMYLMAWWEFRPTFVCVRRSVKGIMGSNSECGYLGTKDPHDMRTIIDAHHSAMDLSSGVNVYTDALVAGDYESLYLAMKTAGLNMDESKVRGFVDPEHWHH